MSIRNEIEAELGAEEIKRQLRDDSMFQEVKDTKDQLEEIIQATKKDLGEIKGAVAFETVVSPARGRDAASADKSSSDTDRTSAGTTDALTPPDQEPESSNKAGGRESGDLPSPDPASSGDDKTG